jgi:hypothetical protein
VIGEQNVEGIAAPLQFGELAHPLQVRCPLDIAGGRSRPGQAARRRTSQTVAAMSSIDSASSQPPSIHWNGQNRLPG